MLLKLKSPTISFGILYFCCISDSNLKGTHYWNSSVCNIWALDVVGLRKALFYVKFTENNEIKEVMSVNIHYNY